VSYDSVHTRHLLADHEDDRDDGALTVAGNEPHLLEEVNGARVTDKTSLELELLGHLLQLTLDVRVVMWKATESGQDGRRQLPVVLLGAPSGAFGREEHSERKGTIVWVSSSHVG
jgi:hypothetical protein